MQPEAGLHESSVQALPSLHGIAALAHEPAMQTSLVQALSSEHGFVSSGIA